MTARMPEFINQIVTGEKDPTVYSLQLDGTKIGWWKDRVEAWARGEKIAPITMDIAWTRKCQAACDFCYAQLQANDGGHVITKQNALEFLDDAAEIGVKGISLISDGESTVVPWFDETIEYGDRLGIQIGMSSNGLRLTKPVLERILPHLTYLRFNFSGGDPQRWAQIMGLKQALFPKIVQNIKDAMEIVRRDNLSCNVNIQMVVMPKHGDQIIPLAKLAKELRPHYLIYKHTANSVDLALDVDYREYSPLFPLFREAETFSDEGFRVVTKWSRIQDDGKRDYQRCFGPPFILQLSGSGLVAPCGQKFAEEYKKFHIGNICETRFKELYQSDRYWDVLRYLASDSFNAQDQCGSNCLQTNSNSWLNKWVNGEVQFHDSPSPPHMGFL